MSASQPEQLEEINNIAANTGNSAAIRTNPRVPESEWDAAANTLFDRFDKNKNNKLDPTELADFREYFDGVFENQANKPPFNEVVKVEDDGSVSRLDFREWFKKNMTFPDQLGDQLSMEGWTSMKKESPRSHASENISKLVGDSILGQI